MDFKRSRVRNIIYNTSESAVHWTVPLENKTCEYSFTIYYIFQTFFQNHMLKKNAYLFRLQPHLSFIEHQSYLIAAKLRI